MHLKLAYICTPEQIVLPLIIKYKIKTKSNRNYACAHTPSYDHKYTLPFQIILIKHILLLQICL